MTELVEELPSARRTHEAQIIRRADGTLRLRLFTWCAEDAPDHGERGSAWAGLRSPATITDAPERARAIGFELIRTHTRDEAADQGEHGE